MPPMNTRADPRLDRETVTPRMEFMLDGDSARSTSASSRVFDADVCRQNPLAVRWFSSLVD